MLSNRPTRAVERVVIVGLSLFLCPHVSAGEDPLDGLIRDLKQKDAKKPAPAAPQEKPIPAEKPVEKSNTVKDSPEPTKKAPQPRMVTPTKDVLHDLSGDNPEQEEKRLAEGKKLISVAEEWIKVGRHDLARQKLKAARKMISNEPKLLASIEKLEQNLPDDRARNKRKARAAGCLSSAITRARDLYSVGRVSEADDLLDGTLRAAELFEDPQGMSFYIESAEKLLSPKSRGNAVESIGRDDQASIQARAPLNHRRLAPDAVGRAPLWYLSQKSKLALPISVDYRKTPLTKVIDDLKAKSGVSIVIDAPIPASRQLADVDLMATAVSTESILNLIGEKYGFEYVIAEKAVVVTTRDRASYYLKQMPENLRRHWASVRYLFPELKTDLLATATGAVDEAGNGDSHDTTPVHLRSGNALVEHVEKLLRDE